MLSRVAGWAEPQERPRTRRGMRSDSSCECETDNHTMKAITLYLGLDVHKDSITIAIAQPGSKGEIRLFGAITNDVGRLEKALERIRKAHPAAHLEVAYEAGPCRFVIPQ